MPTYEYACDACKKTFEVEQRISESPLKKCVKCGKPKARRMISGGTFMLKGGGWYADGYSGKSNGKAETKSEAPSESKPAAKSESNAAE
jgi:putative FmdB family regulatory protein